MTRWPTCERAGHIRIEGRDGGCWLTSNRGFQQTLRFVKATGRAHYDARKKLWWVALTRPQIERLAHDQADHYGQIVFTMSEHDPPWERLQYDYSDEDVPL